MSKIPLELINSEQNREVESLVRRALEMFERNQMIPSQEICGLDYCARAVPRDRYFSHFVSHIAFSGKQILLNVQSIGLS